MKLLVTGACGFIGSHVVELLLSRGHEVMAIAKYSSTGSAGYLEQIIDAPNLTIKYGDITDSSFIASCCKKIDCAINLAALIGIPYSYSNPRHVLEVNLTGCQNILEAARKEKFHTIQISTSEVYGSAQYEPINEIHPYSAQSPYAASKVAADQLCLAYKKSFNIPISVIRPFNTYGPRQSTRAIIPTIIRQLVLSNYIKLGSTETFRDFTFVRDTALGIIKPLDYMIEGEVFNASPINLGTGKTIKIHSLLEEIAKLTNREDYRLELDEIRLRPKESEVLLLRSDNTKAKKILNWNPKTTLSEGLKETIDYYRTLNDKYKSNYQI